jgi:hypothetical protein
VRANSSVRRPHGVSLRMDSSIIPPLLFIELRKALKTDGMFFISLHDEIFEAKTTV